MSFFSGWLSTGEDSSPEVKKATKAYNTFSESPATLPFPSHMLTPKNSINSGESATDNSPMDSIGIEINETYNTSGRMSSVNDATELESIGGKSSKNASKCCKICRKLYKESENSEWACKYHRGKFQASATFTSFGSLKRWSCCQKESENSEGCLAGSHQEDRRVTGILNTFNVSNPVEAEEEEEVVQPKEITVMTPKPKAAKRGEIRHELDKDDTLIKLAVHYNVKVTALKRANKLLGDTIYGRKFLIIPAERD